MNVFVVTYTTCSWLHHKNAQAKEEAIRREQYKRIFFSQPQKPITLRCVNTLLQEWILCIIELSTIDYRGITKVCY